MTTAHVLLPPGPGGSRTPRPTWRRLGLLLGLLSLLASSSTAAAPRPQSTPCADAYEDDGILAQARPLGLGETQAHTFCPPGDADWLSFYAAPDSTYQVTSTNGGLAVSSYVYLFAPDGHTLLVRN